MATEQQKALALAELLINPFYTKEAAGMILNSYQEGLDITKLMNPYFSLDQMKEIIEGLKNGDNVDLFASDKFSARKMHIIRKGLESGYDVSVYADPKFTEKQMERILAGLRDGIDVLAYIDRDFTGNQWAIITACLKYDIDISSCIVETPSNFEVINRIIPLVHKMEPDVNVLNQSFLDKVSTHYLRAVEEELLTAPHNITAQAQKNSANSILSKQEFNDDQQQLYAGLYRDKKDQNQASLKEASLHKLNYKDSHEGNSKELYKYLAQQMYLINRGIKLGIDPSIYTKSYYNLDQMDVILTGIEDGVDISVYIDPKFNAEQMLVIEHGLCKQVDVSVYAKLEYNQDQMLEIYAGLLSGIRVEQYAKPTISAAEMKRIREILESEKRGKIDANDFQ